MQRLLLFLLLLSATFLVAQEQYLDRSATVGFTQTGSAHGISVSDYDRDGDEDLYVARTDGANLLYHNNGDGTFSERAAELGVAGDTPSIAGIWADIDNDGDQDLYVGNRNANDILYQNEGDGTFTDISVSAGIANPATPRSVLFADVDSDGFLDIYLANLSAENVYYHNDGDGTFTNRVVAAGLTDDQISMGAIFFDYDDDNDPDLYLTHDNNQPNILYENQGDGTFLNVAAATGCDYAGFGMGVDVGDLNNDGSLDLYITNLYENTLYLNLGGSFYNISANAETDDRGMGWGTSLLDYNNDGLLDIYAANDSYFSPDPNVLYRNDGNNQFTIVSEGQAEGSLLGSYGTATLDFNNDGRLDLVVANTGTNDACSYLENQHDNDNSWLKVRLVGTQSNRDAVGARVVMLTNEGSMTEEVVAGSGYGSQNSQWLHFGMGSSLWVNQMDVRWPSGQTETFYDLGLNEAITIVEGQGIVNTKQTAAAPQWQIAPNPVRGQLSLLHTNDLNVQAIRMVDAHGRVVLWQTTDGQPTVAVGALPAGVYYLGLLLDSGWEQQRVVVTL